jgi:uncharacterized membrane protein
MRRFYDEDLLGNKLIALLAVVLMHIVLEYAIALVPIVWFFGLPMALILTFTNEDMVNLKGGNNE